MILRKPKVGDRVVYTKSKQSVSPGTRARQVNPAAKGDQYSYVVDKFWTISQVHDDGTATLVTRRGKTHIIQLDDPCLRRANCWERLFYAARFPCLGAKASQPAAPPDSADS